MAKGRTRDAWVAYLRVSTPEQAERDLSLPAQRRAVDDYATRAGQSISREYVEEGCSGTHMNRKAFRRMLEDIFRPGSDIGTIVVHHTSRFTRNATEARVVKEKFRKEGVRVVSVCQETNDDPVGQLIEGIFECIDQYESEVNGMRTSAAMREAVRQGYFPGAGTPFGFITRKTEIRPNVFRSTLVRDENEAAIVRQLFQLYVAGNGAKSVAKALNDRRLFYRRGSSWSKDLVLHVLDEPAVAGTYFWGPPTRRSLSLGALALRRRRAVFSRWNNPRPVAARDPLESETRERSRGLGVVDPHRCPQGARALLRMRDKGRVSLAYCSGLGTDHGSHADAVVPRGRGRSPRRAPSPARRCASVTPCRSA